MNVEKERDSLSRIQDARRKTEGERSHPPGLTVALEPVEEGVNGRARFESASQVAPRESIAAPAQFQSSISDELRNRCFQAAWSPDANRILFLEGKSESAGAEEFRTLRAKLYQAREKRPLKKILVTSPVPQEGRSFVAANLAHVLALQPSSRVLLIDADLRNPGLHVLLGTTTNPGLTEYLMGGVEEFVVMQRGRLESLYFIPAGGLPVNPSDALANGRVKSLLQSLEGMFDWIVIDSPAALPVSDAAQVANFCDGVLLVVRSSSTPFDVARNALGRFRQEHILGVLLNGTAPAAPSGSQQYRGNGRSLSGNGV